jgi:hypothetical protein
MGLVHSLATTLKRKSVSMPLIPKTRVHGMLLQASRQLLVRHQAPSLCVHATALMTSCTFAVVLPDQSLHWIPQTTSSRVAQHSESKVSRLVNMLLIKTAPPSNKMVVNVGTWFWVPRSVWKSVSVTAYIPTSVGPITVTTTATPTSLIYSPGDGNSAVTCRGPGTPWSQSRGDNDTSNCMYTYTSASHTRQAGTYAANTAIKWTVTWRSNLGIGGLLPSIRTGLTTPVRVLEMQALSR